MPDVPPTSPEEQHQGRYRTIVADPPWAIERLGKLSWREGRPSGDGMALDYETMPVDAIATLPVEQMAAEDAHLFLWTTQRHTSRTDGSGGRSPVPVDDVIYATRGSVGRIPQIDRQWFTWARGEHSAKPEAFLDLVEAHFPEPRLEMFSRRARFGWDYWGDEALGGLSLGAARAPVLVPEEAPK